ncbi:MAG TPA: hypothetical protein VD833_19115 [Vicinamibacterales bacterium]|nr:hypothetical protein [Vicinamibacterales bacterium]
MSTIADSASEFNYASAAFESPSIGDRQAASHTFRLFRRWLVRQVASGHDCAWRLNITFSKERVDTRSDGFPKSGYSMFTLELTVALKSSLLFICIL